MQRRDFLQLTAAGLASALAARPIALLAAQQSRQAIALTAGEWTTLQTLCNHLLPPVNGISVSDAGVVNLIDKLLAHEEQTSLPLYRSGLLALDAYARQHGKDNWVSLNDAQQIASLEQMEDGVISPWPDTVDAGALFAMLRFHTLLGFLASPNHGGNRNHAGWQAIGFPGHLHMQGGISDQQVRGED